MNFSLQDKPCSNQMADSWFPTAVISHFYSAVYVYFEYYEDGATRQKYCGPEGSDQGRLKALAFEHEHVKAKRDALNERLSKIKKDMD